MNKILTTLLASAMSLTMSAQAPSHAYLNNINKGKIGLPQVRNLSDAQIQKINEHTHGHALPLPTKAETAKMLKQALASRPSKAKAQKSNSNIVERYSTANYTADDILMFESWEDWIINFREGATKGFNWRPATWLHKSNFDADTYISEATFECPTWMCESTDGYYAPYATDGNAILLCMPGDDKWNSDSTALIAPAPEQDEWIASPVVSSVQATNFLSFDLAFMPIRSHLFFSEENPIDINRLAYDVEVLVTTSTRSTEIVESNYTCIFKLSDIVSEMIKGANLEDEETLSNLLNYRWQHFKLPLADYAGKNIRVAFRYKGKMGGEVLLDAVRVSDMLPVAKYDKPEGSFYFGFSSDGRNINSKLALMPAYTETKWTNLSNEDSETFEWTYNVNGEEGQSTEKNLIMPAVKPGTINWPSLVSASGTHNDMYCGGLDWDGDGEITAEEAGLAKAGGSAFLSDNITQVDFTVGNFDATKGAELPQVGNQMYAFGTGSDAFWAATTNYRYNKVSGIANVFDKPAAPYVFNSVTLPLGVYQNWGADLVCTVYKVEELPGGGLEITDVVLGQANANNATSIPEASIYMLTFNFPNVMTVDSHIAISITGVDNDLIMGFAPITQSLNHDCDMGYAFVILKNASTNKVYWGDIAELLATYDETDNMKVSHAIGMNAIFPYLHSNDGDVFNASVDGEKKSFDIDSYWYPEKKGAQSLDGWTIECSDSWVKAVSTLDADAQKAGVDITAEALPAGMTGRTATVTIKALGCEETITVVQGDATAINGINSNVLSRSNGAYTISGQRINSADAKNGLFIVKKGNKYVKVLK